MSGNFETYALVTGAASGMGRIYAERLAAKGYNLVIVDINARGLDETAAEVRSNVHSCEILSLVQDLSAADAADPQLHGCRYIRLRLRLVLLPYLLV